MSHHQPQINTSAKSQLATSIGSMILSFLASSHHWLHMAILFVFGSSTGVMASMSSMIGVRRFMIAATLITTTYSLYRLRKHKHMSAVVKSITIISAAVSLLFVLYSIYTFGW